MLYIEPSPVNEQEKKDETALEENAGEGRHTNNFVHLSTLALCMVGDGESFQLTQKNVTFYHT